MHQQQCGWGPPPPPPGYNRNDQAAPLRGPTLGDISIEFPYANLYRATDGFHASKKLGSGAFGAVYAAEMADGSKAAVKFLDLRAFGGEAGMSGFEEEITTLSKFRHPNLIVLMGWGRHDACRFLIYEFMPGGDVHGRLRSCQSSPSTKPFPWRERVAVLLDAATGLAYLHNATPHAFHRDIKSTNILLGPSGAKMADFGLSCVAEIRRSRSGDRKRSGGAPGTALQCQTPAGTAGYICPVYAATGRLTEGSEVYSFGMVLLEVLLNMMPAMVDPSGFLTYPLDDQIRPKEPGGIQRALAKVDPAAAWPSHGAAALSKLAFECIDMADARRPIFNDICHSLRAIEKGERSTKRRGTEPATKLTHEKQLRRGTTFAAAPQPGWGGDASPRHHVEMIARKSVVATTTTHMYVPPQDAPQQWGDQWGPRPVAATDAAMVGRRRTAETDSCADRCVDSCSLQ